MLLLWASIGRPPALPVLPPDDALRRQQIAEEEEVIFILSMLAAYNYGQDPLTAPEKGNATSTSPKD